MKINLISESVDGFAKHDRVVVRIGKDEWYTGTVTKNGSTKLDIDLDEIKQEYINAELASLDEDPKESDKQKKKKALLEEQEAGIHEIEVEGKDLKWVLKLKVADVFHHKLSMKEAKALAEKDPPPEYLKKYENVKPRLAEKHIPASQLIGKYAPGLFAAIYDLVKGKSSPVQLVNIHDPERERAWVIDSDSIKKVLGSVEKLMEKMGYEPSTTAKDTWQKGYAQVVLERNTEKYAKVIIKIDKLSKNSIPILAPPKREKVSISPHINIANLEQGTILKATNTVHGHIELNDQVTVIKVGSKMDKFQVKTEDNKTVTLTVDDLRMFKEV